jgi:tetratricopeptide (TPR) repeat protein
MTARSIAIVMACLFLMAIATSPCRAQNWEWPQKAKNLKVLPADFPPERLRAVMMGFTRALGVRCTYCHVGEEGKPLTSFDFVTDKNPKKNVARGMLRMLGKIDDQLKEIQPDKKERVNMWCHTCHRGRPLPMTLGEELGRVYAQRGADSTLAHYRDLRERFYGAGSYDFRERSLNELGYDLLGKKDVTGALAILRLNAEQFPQSGNVYDNLGEAYLAAGDTVQAIAQYRTAVELDPKNPNAAKVLEKLTAAGTRK